MMLPRRRFLHLGGAALAMPFVRSASAQTYPNRYVRFIVPFPPGGASDPVARVLGARLSEIWGQQVVIENKGGAGDNLGALAAVQSPPDGYTIFITRISSRPIHSSMPRSATTRWSISRR